MSCNTMEVEALNMDGMGLQISCGINQLYAWSMFEVHFLLVPCALQHNIKDILSNMSHLSV
jgi:hypothetical protein